MLRLQHLPSPRVRVSPRVPPPSNGRQRTRLSSIAVAVAGAGIPELQKSEHTSTARRPLPSSSLTSTVAMVYSPAPLIELGRRLRVSPNPQLGLLSIFFVLSTALGAIFSLAILSIPTMIAFARLAASMNKLSNVVSKEVPGTISSLKLSGLEINDLTQQLSSLRQNISGISSYGKKNKAR